MPRFEYYATDADGRRVTGDVTAASQADAEQLLAARGLRVEQLDPAELMAPTAGIEADSSADLTEADFLDVATQVADLTNAGLPLASGLRALSEEMSSMSVSARRGLAELSRRLEAGEPLDQAISHMGRRVPPHLAALVQVGLQTGNPGLLMQHYLSYAQMASDLRRRVFLGTVYPLILIFAASAILTFLLTVIVPNFGRIFEDFDTALPAATVGVLALSHFMVNYALPTLVGLVIWVWLLRRLIVTLGGPESWRWVMLRLPLVGPLMQYFAVAKFCHLLALMTESRLQFPTALRLAGNAANDALLSSGAVQLAQDVERGTAPDEALERVEGLPTDLVPVFRWSRKPGLLAEGLHAAGEIYSARARVQASLIAMICEPLILIGVAVLIGGVVLALFLPLFKLLNDLS